MMSDMPFDTPAIEKLDYPPRNLRTNYQETFDAIASIENKPGSLWLSEQAEDMADLHAKSFPNAIRWLTEHPSVKSWGHFDIYGYGGVNRWRVARDGGISYVLDIESKAGNVEDARRARELGFQVIGKKGPMRHPYAPPEEL